MTLSTLDKGAAQKYAFHFSRTSYINNPASSRPVLFSLSPCVGATSLLIRKSVPCWPDAFSCCDNCVPPPCADSVCPYTTYSGPLDGSEAGGTTLLQVPLSSMDYFLTVLAYNQTVERAEYELLVISDTGALPFPGNQGSLQARIDVDSDLVLEWKEAYFQPKTYTSVDRYEVWYLELAIDFELPNEFSPNVFLNQTLILNTPCGMKRNMTLADVDVSCKYGVCSSTVAGLKYTKKYIFNILVVSTKGLESAYSGILVTDAGKHQKAVTDNDVVAIIAATASVTIVTLLLAYAWVGRLLLFHTLDNDTHRKDPN